MRIVLVLSALCAVALGVPLSGALRLPLRRQHRPVVARPGQESPGLQNAASQPLGLDFKDSGPFDDYGVYRDEIFTIDVTLGTPPVACNVTLDYGLQYAYFFDEGDAWRAQLPICWLGGPPPPSRHYYNARKSSSATKDSRPLPEDALNLGEPYLPASCAKLGNTLVRKGTFLYADTLKINAQSFTPTFVYAPATMGVLSQNWPGDAVLGLGRGTGKTRTDGLSAIESILARMPLKVITIYFDSKERSNALLDGHVTFGDIDTANCDSKWSYTANTDPVAWGFATTFSYGGNFRIGQQLSATMQSTTALITAPPNAVSTIVEAAGADYDFASDTFVVECSTIGTLPDMVFELDGGFEYRLPDKDYVRQLPGNKEGQCTLMLTGGTYHVDKWSLGSTFGRSHCALLDYANNRIGFAKVLH